MCTGLVSWDVGKSSWMKSGLRRRSSAFSAKVACRSGFVGRSLRVHVLSAGHPTKRARQIQGYCGFLTCFQRPELKTSLARPLSEYISSRLQLRLRLPTAPRNHFSQWIMRSKRRRSILYPGIAERRQRHLSRRAGIIWCVLRGFLPWLCQIAHSEQQSAEG